MKNLLLVAILFSAFYGYSQTTYVPDDNFEQALIDLGYDDVLDDYVLTANIDARTELVLDNLDIEDVTGLEDFIALTNLSVIGNWDLLEIDLTNNTALTDLNLSDNGFEDLDLSQNILLTYLDVNSNWFVSLDLSQNTFLTYLDANWNELESLDLSQNTALTYIDLWFNVLTSLDIRNGNNSNVTYFDSADNGGGLSCVSVDDAAYSTTNWTNIDDDSSFSEDCSLGVDDFKLSQSQLYPNPVSDILTIRSSVAIEKVDIFNTLGKQVMTSSETQLDASRLSPGIYFVNITSENGNAVKKFIKK